MFFTSSKKNNFVIFVATKKGRKTPFSFVAVVGSGIRDPGWIKIRIRDNIPDLQC
jgi:hypothetical protein